MTDAVRRLIQLIDSLALDAIMLDSEDMHGLGKALKSLETIEELLEKIKEESMLAITRAMNRYIEKVILGELSDLYPFETAISQLQEMSRRLFDGMKIDEDISPVLSSLGHEERKIPLLSSAPSPSSLRHRKETLHGYEDHESGEKSLNIQGKSSPGIIVDDKEIVSDFISESLENLGKIEVSLMDLEQDSSDIETINTIFRSFHTIKGVSGFLNFNKMSKIAHVVENLLDKARGGDLSINGETIDIVLDSVDLLKRMIENVRVSMDQGVPSEGDIDTKGVVSKVEDLMAAADDEVITPPGEILIANRAISKDDVQDAIHVRKEGHDEKVGEILLEQQGKAKGREAASAPRDQKRFGRAVALQAKVDTEKLDRLVDMIGELAIAQSILRQHEFIKAHRDKDLDGIMNQLNQITSDLQRNAMSLRMVPLSQTFQKMLRIVRDLAKKSGKEIQLVISGADTEIDRNMVDEIYEPMVHMIRNSIDHGLEPPQEREAIGKARQGTIYLRASHRRGDVVIEIEDDGRGLDSEKILQSARAKGVIGEGEILTEEEITKLIFHPGLTTAQEIGELSGRGVGMDVVSSRIKKLRGKIDVSSVDGKGTIFSIRLPLTLAMIHGMVVKVGSERYVIPSLSVQESFRPRRTECHTVMGAGEMIMVRDQLFPLIRLDRLFGMNGTCNSRGKVKGPWESLVVVVENREKRKCLLVDELLGQEELVIKGLGEGLKDLRGIAGGVIMGDGTVGLVLDIPGIFNLATEELR